MISDMNHGKNNIKDLAEISQIKYENIDMNAYFLSLTDNAFDAGLLTEKDMEYIQMQIYDILSENVWMYTNGTSTSVTTKEANEFMISILHVLDHFCISETGAVLTAADEIKFIEMIKIFKEKSGVKNCYQKGLEFLGRTSAKDIAIDNMKKEVKETIESYENLIDFDEVSKFEKEMESTDIEKKIVSQSNMTDVEFNILYEKITWCKTAEKKADLIINSVSSAADFLDILNAQCLFDDDYLTLYRKLPVESVAFLIQTLSGGLAFYDFDAQDIDSLAESNFDEEWQKYLAEFILELNENDKKIIVEFMQNL